MENAVRKVSIYEFTLLCIKEIWWRPLSWCGETQVPSVLCAAFLVHGQSVHWSASPHSHLPCDRDAAFLVELGSCSCRKLHQDACQLDMLSTAMTYRMEEEHVLGRPMVGPQPALLVFSLKEAQSHLLLCMLSLYFGNYPRKNVNHIYIGMWKIYFLAHCTCWHGKPMCHL